MAHLKKPVILNLFSWLEIYTDRKKIIKNKWSNLIATCFSSTRLVRQRQAIIAYRNGRVSVRSFVRIIKRSMYGSTDRVVVNVSVK